MVIPEDIVQASRMSESDLKLEIAIMLYTLGRISSGKVRSWTGLNVIEFQRELDKRELYLNYDVDDLQHDVETLQRLNVL